MNARELPFKIKIASPCPARWADMGGDDRVRFCDLCHKNVYNLSAMTAAEAAALVESKKGQLCARIYQRPDGTVLTEDCPVGVARQWRRLKSLVAGGVATMLFALAYTTAMAREDSPETSADDLRDRIAEAFDNVTWAFLGLFDKHRPAVMGVVANITPTSPPTPAPVPASANPPTTDKQ